MNKNDTKVKTSIRNFILALILLLITNISMGVTLMVMAKHTLRDELEQHMLDITNSAAHLLYSNDYSKLTKNDSDTELYKSSYDILSKFQNNIELDYIYLIRPDGDGTFSYIIDPDPDEPAEFGESIQNTDSLIAASRGTPSVDKTSHTDDWGTFYSSYAPVYDSDNNITAIVGVDFEAAWYDGKLSSNRAVTAIITMVALSVGIVLSAIIMSQNRKRFGKISNEIKDLNFDLQKIDAFIMEHSIKKLDMLPESESSILKSLAAGETNMPAYNDEYDELSSGIAAVKNKLEKYTKFIDASTYTDDMTGVGNKAAYKNAINEMNESISADNAVFSVVFFDINDLKNINTIYGFEIGDEFMYATANILKNVFGKKNIFRVASDEFIAIMKDKKYLDMDRYIIEFNKAINAFNASRSGDPKLSVAKGVCTYSPDIYDSYRSVFIQAEKNMEKDKAVFHANNN